MIHVIFTTIPLINIFVPFLCLENIITNSTMLLQEKYVLYLRGRSGLVFSKCNRFKERNVYTFAAPLFEI